MGSSAIDIWVEEMSVVPASRVRERMFKTTLCCGKFAGMVSFICNHLYHLDERISYHYLISDLKKQSGTCDLTIRFIDSNFICMITFTCSSDLA